MSYLSNKYISIHKLPNDQKCLKIKVQKNIISIFWRDLSDIIREYQFELADPHSLDKIEVKIKECLQLHSSGTAGSLTSQHD